MYLKNSWYPAAWAHELLETPIARTLLGEETVLFRTASGKPVAFEDRCCHRAAPLSRGLVRGEHLQCGYHGLEFDDSGCCVNVPAQANVPPAARVKRYATHERWKMVWIWMGDPDRADPATVPDLAWLDDPSWGITPGYLHLEANYQLLVDNLLDLTHVSYLHRNTLNGDPREATTPQKAETTEDGVRIVRWLLDVIPPPLFAQVGNFSNHVDRWQLATWHAPATVVLDVGCADAGTGAPLGDRSRGISMYSNHLIAPETETSSHYFFCFARNFGLGDERIAELLYEGSRATFIEDKEMLEAQQRRLPGGSIDGLVNISSDGGQIQARRILSRLIEAERV